jgi:hypothetical protein
MANRTRAPASAADVGDDILDDRLTLLVNTDEAPRFGDGGDAPTKPRVSSFLTYANRTSGQRFQYGIPERVTWIR